MHRIRKIKVHKVHKEGTGLLLSMFTVLFIVNVMLCYTVDNPLIFHSVLVASAVLFLIVLNFFRSPYRRFPYDSEGLVIAPADGTIVAIEEVNENQYLKERRLQVSIFMSVFNVHANWFPVNGTVLHVSHRRGRFQAAYLPKSSTENERSTIVIRTHYGVDVLTRQIAGVLARRIVTYAKEGECCEVNDQMGFIKFGSRVDVFLPLDTEILVEMGQKVTGNQTPIARLGRITFLPKSAALQGKDPKTPRRPRRRRPEVSNRPPDREQIRKSRPRRRRRKTSPPTLPEETPSSRK
jgi:phosphatidylserine decarboxylase